MKKLLLLALLVGLIQTPNIIFAMEKDDNDEKQELDVPDLEEKPTCSICHKSCNDDHKPITLPLCNHTFGLECIKACVKKNQKKSTCPACDKEYVTKDLLLHIWDIVPNSSYPLVLGQLPTGLLLLEDFSYYQHSTTTDQDK